MYLSTQARGSVPSTRGEKVLFGKTVLDFREDGGISSRETASVIFGAPDAAVQQHEEEEEKGSRPLGLSKDLKQELESTERAKKGTAARNREVASGPLSPNPSSWCGGSAHTCRCMVTPGNPRGLHREAHQ